jgi:hypothetical protein
LSLRKKNTSSSASSALQEKNQKLPNGQKPSNGQQKYPENWFSITEMAASGI